MLKVQRHYTKQTHRVKDNSKIKECVHRKEETGEDEILKDLQRYKECNN